MVSKTKQCSCGCGKEYTPYLRNGIPTSTLHPNCYYKQLTKKSAEQSSNPKAKKKRSKNFNLYTTTAWKWFRKYVIVFYAQSNGVIQCSTSGRFMNLYTPEGRKKVHCGHYIKVKDGSLSHYAVAFDFKNVGPQHMQDNTYSGGKPEIMRKWLIKEHGEEAIKALEVRKNNICHPDKVWLDEIAKEYKRKYKELLINKKMKDPWAN